VSAANLLEHLDGIRRTGQDRWIAKCPAHPDKSPSLAVRELTDGRVLVHCFAGCEVENVLSAVGLTFSDLFPEQAREHKRERRPFPAADVLACMAHESLIALLAATDLSRGMELSREDVERLAVASSRIAEGHRLANGR
jgi:hypothetical protein